MKILLTGSTGFLGRHLKVRLEKLGHEVLPFGRHDTLSTLDGREYQVAINCAAELDNPLDMESTNLGLTGDLLWACRAKRARLIQIGSSSETGPVEGPRSELTPCVPTTLYEGTKLAATNLCLGHAGEYDIDVCVARPFTLYGPNDKPRKMLPTLWRTSMAGEPFHCYPGGHDWLHVEDFVDAIILLLNAPREATKGQIYHFGTGISTSNSHVVELFGEAIGFHVPVVYHPQKFRPYDVHDWCADSSKAKARLGWTPKISLEEGIHRFIGNERFKQEHG